MTSMQQDAIALIQGMPEEELSALLVIMRAMGHGAEDHRRSAKHRAFQELEQLRRPIPNLDEKKELADWRRERFCCADTD